MDDLEAIRQRRLRELQAAQAAAAAQDPAAAQDAAAEQAAAQEAAIERILLQVLDTEARDRLQRIRMSRPDLGDAVARQLVALAQQGRLAKRLGDAELKALLQQATPPSRDYNITRK